MTAPAAPPTARADVCRSRPTTPSARLLAFSDLSSFAIASASWGGTGPPSGSPPGGGALGGAYGLYIAAHPIPWGASWGARAPALVRTHSTWPATRFFVVQRRQREADRRLASSPPRRIFRAGR